MADIFGSGNRKDKWVKKATEWINYLFNHKSDTLVAGQNITLTPDSTNHTVTIDSTASGGASSLADLTDTDIDNPTDGQALVYDDGEWVNAPLPSAPVTDVEVDGTSVVNASGVAEIDLTDYAKSADLPTKVSDLQNDSGFISTETDPTVPSWAKASTKPIYTASEVGAIPTTDKGVSNGVASLGSDGKVPSSQLPSYVDDVLEYASKNAFPATGESGKIYIALDTNKTYRWSGSEYVEISESLALGETNSTAYYGDKGKTAYDHSQLISGNPHNVTKTDIGLWNVPNVTTNNQTPTFTEASTRSNIASGETLATIFGKIKKFFTDLKAVAFSGAYSDLSGQPTKLSDFTNDVVNNGTLTITQNGTSKGTFTANQSGNSTIALTDTTYSVATTSANGLMSSTDKSKLNTLTQDFRGIVTVEAANSFVAGWRRFAKITASGNYGSALLAFRGGWTNNAPYVGTVLYTFRNNEAKLRILDGFCQPNNVHQKLRAVRISANNYYLEMYRLATSTANSAQYCDIVPISGTQNWTVTETSDTPPINNNATGVNDYEISLLEEQFMPYQTDTGYIGTADKAWKEGYINNLHGNVDGSATKLTKTETVLQTNQVPYVSRASLSPECFSGYIREMLVGGSVGWNQNIYNGNFVDTSKWVFDSKSTASASNNILTLTANAAGALLSAYPDTAYRKTWQVGHKILATLDAKTSTSGLAIRASLAYETVLKNTIISYATLTSSWQSFTKIVNITEATDGIRIAHPNYTAVAVGDAYQVRNVYAVDLTILFGSEIADYIYSLESSTAGAGVSLLRSLGFFTEPYYAQDNGSIQSVCVNAKKICGKNLYDKSAINTSNGYKSNYYLDNTGAEVANANLNISEYIKVVAGETYTYSGTTGAAPSICFYDSNKTFISGYNINGAVKLTVQAPSNSCYVRLSIRKSQIDVTQLEFGLTATSYEPYHIDTIPLSATDLRGILKLDSNNNIYFDGDEYTSDGKIKRKYGIVNLGTLTWGYATDNQYNVFYAEKNTLPALPAYPANKVTIVCAKFVPHYNCSFSVFANGNTSVDNSIAISSSGTVQRILVRADAYTDAATFKTAMDRVYLVYELATPTEETALSYQNPQYAKDGTEEFVDGKTRDIIVPVGHVTEYMGATAGEYQVMPTMPVDENQYELVADNHELTFKETLNSHYANHKNALDLTKFPNTTDDFSIDFVNSGSGRPYGNNLSWAVLTFKHDDNEYNDYFAQLAIEVGHNNGLYFRNGYEDSDFGLQAGWIGLLFRNLTTSGIIDFDTHTFRNNSDDIGEEIKIILATDEYSNDVYYAESTLHTIMLYTILRNATQALRITVGDDEKGICGIFKLTQTTIKLESLWVNGVQKYSEMIYYIYAR